MDLIFSRLEDVTSTGPSQYIARCPAHDDHKPSLSIRCTPDGKILLYCHAGCSFNEILRALFLNENDRAICSSHQHSKFSDNPRKINTTKVVSRDIYSKYINRQKESPFGSWLKTTANCSFEHQKKFYIGYDKNGFTVYFQLDQERNIINGKKILYDKNGHRIKGRTGFPLIKKSEGGQQILFGLWQLPTDKPIILTESEKTALILSAWIRDYVWIAKGSANGLNKRKATPLSNYEVVLLVDADKAGRKTAMTDKALLKKLGCRVTIFDPFPQYSNGFDLADWWIDKQGNFPLGKH